MAPEKKPAKTDLTAEMNAAIINAAGGQPVMAEHLIGGSKLSRSEVVTVRLDPKLRYLAELAARKQRRTLSSFIEWAIE